VIYLRVADVSYTRGVYKSTGLSIVLAVGLGSSGSSGSRGKARLEKRLKKKSILDILKTLYRESAIALL